jgi:Holliday junction resolvase RusA-like endonuclease
VTRTLTINVVGTPTQQGSKTAGVTKEGKAYTRDANAKTLKPWRAEVAACAEQAARDARWETTTGPTEVVVTFYSHRPASHYGTGRNAGKLKPTAPTWKPTAPDVDKLARAILDALTTSRAIHDDRIVARLVLEDRYADAATGAQIHITPLTEPGDHQ